MEPNSELLSEAKFLEAPCQVCQGRGWLLVDVEGPDGYFLDPQPKNRPREQCSFCEGCGKQPTADYSAWRTAFAAAKALKAAGLPLGNVRTA